LLLNIKYQVTSIFTFIIIIIIIRHELRLDRPVSALSNSLFKVRPSRLLPSGLEFSINVGILLLVMLVTCRGQFDSYLLSFSSTGSTYARCTVLACFCVDVNDEHRNATCSRKSCDCSQLTGVQLQQCNQLNWPRNVTTLHTCTSHRKVSFFQLSLS
jgi:hypothetical protein